MTLQEENQKLKQEIARLRAERQVFKQSVQDSYKTLLNTLGCDDKPQSTDNYRSAFDTND